MRIIAEKLKPVFLTVKINLAMGDPEDVY